MIRQKNLRALKMSGAASLAMLAALGMSEACWAQDTNASGQSEIDSGHAGEIIVTARRVEESLQDVPVAVTALSGVDLQTRQIKTVLDLQYSVPSLTVSPGVGGNTASYSMRGQSQSYGTAAQDSVVSYFAEVPVSVTSTYRQTFDMASIQVLKGPQGTLFGANSNGGAILFVPKKPSDKFESEVRAAIGSYSLRDLTAMMNVPLTDWLQVRAAGNFVRRDGYTKNVNPCPRAFRPVANAGSPPTALEVSPNCGSNAAQDDDRHESWRVSLSVEPVDWFSNQTVYWGVHENAVGGSWVPYRFGGPLVPVFFGKPIAGLIGVPTADAVAAEQAARGPRAISTDEHAWNFNEQGVSNITSVNVGAVTIKNIYGFRASREEQRTDQDGSILPIVQQDLYSAGSTKTHTNELQMLGSLFDDRVKYVAGGFIKREHNPGFSVYGYLYELTPMQDGVLQAIGLGSLIFPNPIGVAPPVARNIHTDSLFANLDVDLSVLAEGLRLSGGYRYSWNTVKSDAPQFLVNGVCTATSNRNQTLDQTDCSLLAKVKDEGYNYSATLQYEFNSDAMVYFSTRRGFRPGGENEPTVVIPELFFFKPETITDFEIGLKSQFEIGHVSVRANLAAYSASYMNVQRSEVIQQPNGNPSAVTVNAQKASIKGFEPELNFRFSRALELSAFYTYLDAKFDKYEVSTGGVTIDKTRTRFTAASKHTLGATLTYHVPISESLGQVVATGSIYYRSSQTFATDNLNQPDDVKVPGYEVVNARVDWRLPSSGLTLSAAVTNLFDKTYALGGADYTNSVVGYANYNYAPPRMFRFEAAYQF